MKNNVYLLVVWTVNNPGESHNIANVFGGVETCNDITSMLDRCHNRVFARIFTSRKSAVRAAMDVGVREWDIEFLRAFD